MTSTFFEDLCQMEARREQFATDPEAFDDIYAKCVTIILSNFEGDANETFVSLDNKLELKFLTNILDSKLNKLGITNINKLQ